jgi:hypothetical protein
LSSISIELAVEVPVQHPHGAPPPPDLSPSFIVVGLPHPSAPLLDVSHSYSITDESLKLASSCGIHHFLRAHVNNTSFHSLAWDII